MSATCNWANQTIWTGDNLPVMRGMNSASVDLIYLDPPFNSKANYAAPIGSAAEGAAFKDTWSLSDVDVEWINLIEAKHPALYRLLLAAMTDNDKSYLAYMAARLLEMRRVLKPAGSIYLHCDPTMSHYLKLMMDAIFGREAFRNEVIWHYRKWSIKAGQYARNHDVILYYAGAGHTFNPQLADPFPGTMKRWKGKPHQSISADDARHAPSSDQNEQSPCPDVWQISIINPNARERVGYPTQKPLALLRRIISASSNPGDIVLDPFCGCATAFIAAEEQSRNWIGIDVSPKSAELVDRRMRDELGLFYNGTHRTDVPRRTDLGKLPPYRSHKQTLYGAQEGNCAGCSEHFEARRLEVDHIIARRNGGTDHIDNLQLLCGSCSRIKGDRGMEYLKAKLQL